MLMALHVLLCMATVFTNTNRIFTDLLMVTRDQIFRTSTNEIGTSFGHTVNYLELVYLNF